MDVFLRFVFTLHYGIMSGTLICSLWIDVPHFYTVYLENRTWNDAREHCRSTRAQLLGVTSQTDWKFWMGILNDSQSQNQRSVDGIYWMGLHAPDPDALDLYFWDNCTVPEYTEPAKHDPPTTYYQCAVMSIGREGFTDTFHDMWLKGIMCNEMHPFICMVEVDDQGCVHSCDEVVVLTNPEVCEVLCDNSACRATYISELKMCHLIPNSYDSPVHFTLCYLPSMEYTPNICMSESRENVRQTTDTNISVTDTVCSEQNSDLNATGPSVEDKQCICLCNKLWTFLATPAPEVVNLTVEEKTEIIIKELTVEKKNTTISQRKYISVMDNRPTSVGIGIVAGVIILSILAVIVIIDLSVIWHELHHMLVKIFILLKTPVDRIKMQFAKPDVTKTEDGFENENNVKSSEDSSPGIPMSNMSGVGWFLRERAVYRNTEPGNARPNCASNMI